MFELRRRFSNIPIFGKVATLIDPLLGYEKHYRRDKMKVVFSSENPDDVMREFRKLLAKKTNQSFEQIVHQHETLEGV